MAWLRTKDCHHFMQEPQAPKQYECLTCKCLMWNPAKTVPHGSLYSTPPTQYHYCGKCVPAFDEVRDGMYYKKIRCNFDGTPYVEPTTPLWTDNYGLGDPTNAASRK